MTKLLKGYFSSSLERSTQQIKYYLDWCHHRGLSLTEENGYQLVKTSKGVHNYDPFTGISFGRMPMRHREIMEKIKKGKLLSIPIVGVKSYIISNTLK